MNTLRLELKECPASETVYSSKLTGFDPGRRFVGATEAQERRLLLPETSSRPVRATSFHLDPNRSRTGNDTFLEGETSPATERVRFDCQTVYPVAQSSFAPIARTAPASRHRDARDLRVHSSPLAISAD